MNFNVLHTYYQEYFKLTVCICIADFTAKIVLHTPNQSFTSKNMFDYYIVLMACVGFVCYTMCSIALFSYTGTKVTAKLHATLNDHESAQEFHLVFTELTTAKKCTWTLFAGVHYMFGFASVLQVLGHCQLYYAIVFAVLYSSNSLRVTYKTIKYIWDCHVFEKDCSGTQYTEIRTVCDQEVEVYIQA
jgi:hypothetical protein